MWHYALSQLQFRLFRRIFFYPAICIIFSALSRLSRCSSPAPFRNTHDSMGQPERTGGRRSGPLQATRHRPHNANQGFVSTPLLGPGPPYCLLDRRAGSGEVDRTTGGLPRGTLRPSSRFYRRLWACAYRPITHRRWGWLECTIMRRGRSCAESLSPYHVCDWLRLVPPAANLLFPSPWRSIECSSLLYCPLPLLLACQACLHSATNLSCRYSRTCTSRMPISSFRPTPTSLCISNLSPSLSAGLSLGASCAVIVLTRTCTVMTVS